MKLKEVKKILAEADVRLYGKGFVRGIQVFERDSHVLITYRNNTSSPASANSDLHRKHERGEIWLCANVLKDLYQVSIWTGTEGPPHQPFLLVHLDDQPTGEILKVPSLKSLEGK